MDDLDKAKRDTQIESYLDDLREIRRDIHQHPETAYEENRTADIVAEKLEAWGLDVNRGLGKTGVVGTLRRGGSNRAIGLRADMDALFIHEMNEFDHRSVNKGKMHACGHDGHTTMLLGAARYLSAAKSFNGTIHFIFQPAEEGGAGAKAMMEDGLFEKFACDAVYGLHNMPGIETGHIGVRAGPVMAGSDEFKITFRGTGGHGSMPHKGTDATIAAAQFIVASQTLVSREINPLEAGVVSVGYINGGAPGSLNIIPAEMHLGGRIRSFKPEVRDLLERRVDEMAKSTAAVFNCEADVNYRRGYPPTVNWTEQAEISLLAAKEAVGEENVIPNMQPLSGSEDFSFMLEKVPGCYVFIGNGMTGPDEFVHAPRYDFNDEITARGVAYWTEIVRAELP
jgi:amidohydrolase